MAVIDDGDGIAYGTIDPARARLRRVSGEPIMNQRRPELYMELMTNAFSWNPNEFFRLYGHEPIPEGRRACVAVGRFTPATDIHENLQTVLRLTEDAKARAAELVVFPSLALTGSTDPRTTAMPATDPSLETLKTLSDKLDVSIVVGFAERDNAAFYSSAAIMTPSRAIAVYRQIHLTEREQVWATHGSESCVLDLAFGRVSVMIGHDAAFPDTARILALRGCDLIRCPANLQSGFHFGHESSAVCQPDPIPFGSDPVHWHHYRVRAGEINCYLAFANMRAIGSNTAGLSGIFGPDTFAFPRKEAIIHDGDLAVAEIDLSNIGPTYPTNVARRKDLMLMRQPHHYEPLIR